MSEQASPQPKQPINFDMSGAPSFVLADQGEIDYWAVIPCGHAETDVARGDAMAGEALRYSTFADRANLIALALHSIAQQAEPPGPIECGFMARIACAAAAGSLS